MPPRHFLPFTGSLWHKRAGLATLWATHFITIWNNVETLMLVHLGPLKTLVAACLVVLVVWVLTWPRYVNYDRCSPSDNDSHLTPAYCSSVRPTVPRMSQGFQYFLIVGSQQYLITWGVDSQILTRLRTHHKLIWLVPRMSLFHSVNWRNGKVKH